MHGQNIHLPVCVCVCVCVSVSVTLSVNSPIQVRPLNGFLQLIAWKTRIHTRMCLLGVSMMDNHIYGSKVPQKLKPPILGSRNRHFKPNMRKIQIAISSDLCITLIWNLAGSCGQQQRLRGWSRMVVKQFQDGGRPPFWKSIYRHISVKNHRMFKITKFTGADIWGQSFLSLPLISFQPVVNGRPRGVSLSLRILSHAAD